MNTTRQRLDAIAERNAMPMPIGASGTFAYLMSAENFKRKMAGEIISMRSDAVLLRRLGRNHRKIVADHMTMIAHYRRMIQKVAGL